MSNSKSHKKNLKCLETIPLKNLSGHSQKFDQIEISSDDSVFDNAEEITPRYLGLFSPVNSRWQRQKCKELMFTFVGGVIYENEAYDKTLQITKLAPSKEKRISPDGNCLFRSLSYVLTGTDYYHKEIRALLIHNITNNYLDQGFLTFLK